MRAKRPGQHHTIYLVHAHFIHQQARARIKRGFGELNRADVALGHGDFGAAIGAGIMDQIGKGAPFGLTTRGANLLGRADQAAFIQNTGHAHFGDGLDDARPADAGDASGGNGGVKARLIRPQIRSDHAETGFFGVRVDLDPLDRPRRGPLARADLRALKGRAGGRRTGQNAAFVPQQNFCIGAHIDHQHQILGFARLFRQRNGGCVRAHMACDTGQNIDLRARVHRGQIQIAGLHLDHLGRGQRKGRLPQLDRVQPQQQVVHHWVADKHDLHDQGRINATLFSD